MRSETYTNAVLTIIALALAALVAQNFVAMSRAQPAQVQQVQICGYDQSISFNCAPVGSIKDALGRSRSLGLLTTPGPLPPAE